MVSGSFGLCYVWAVLFVGAGVCLFWFGVVLWLGMVWVCLFGVDWLYFAFVWVGCGSVCVWLCVVGLIGFLICCCRLLQFVVWMFCVVVWVGVGLVGGLVVLVCDVGCLVSVCIFARLLLYVSFDCWCCWFVLLFVVVGVLFVFEVGFE